MAREPKPPEGLRLIDPNGKEWPCNVAFSHTDLEGINHWKATPIGLTRDLARVIGGDISGWQIKMDVLPGFTAVEWERG